MERGGKTRENALKHLILKKRSALNAKKNIVLSRRAALNHKNARHNTYIFLFLKKKALFTAVQIQAGMKQVQKKFQKVFLKTRFAITKTTRVVFKLSRCLFLPTTA